MKKNVFKYTFLCVSMLFVLNGFAQDTPQWHLPAGIKARIGKGHAADIALSRDGTQIAVATGIGIWLYEVSSGTEVALLTGHSDQVNSVEYSPKDGTLASASPKEIRLWNPGTQQHKTTFRNRGGSSLTYSADGSTLAIADWDREYRVRLLNANTGQIQRTFRWEGDSARTIAFSSNGSVLAVGDWGGTIRLWNTGNGKLQRMLSGHKWGINALVFSPDGKTLTSKDQRDIRLWNLNSGKNTQTLQRGGSALAYSPDGSKLVVGDCCGNIIFLNPNTDQVQQTLSGHEDNISSLVFSTDGDTLVSSSWDGTIRLWNAKTGQHTRTLEGHFNITGVALSPKGNTIATTINGGVFYWNGLNGRFEKSVLRTGSTGLLAYRPGSYGLAVAVWAGEDRMRLLNANTDQIQRAFRWEGASASAIAFSSNGGVLAAGDWDGTVRLWNAGNGKLQQTLSGHSGSINSVVFSPDGKTLASGGGWNDETVRLWNTGNGKLQRTLSGHSGSINTLVFSPDGKTLAGGSWNEIRLWNPQNGTLQRTLNGSGDALAYSPDGRILASGEHRGIRLWNPQNGTLQQRLTGPGSGVTYLAFSPDGSTLVSSGWNGAVLLWNMNKLPRTVAEDVNRDGIVDVSDLVQVASHFGESVTTDASPDPDINDDGVVDRKDILQVIGLLEAAAETPLVNSQPLRRLTVDNLQHWIDRTKQLDSKDETVQRGIRVLEALLETLSTQVTAPPIKTALLPNYPNPFNPETWIPYQLATPADVQITIYDAKGAVVRMLVLGHQPEGYYTEQQRAAYWDGRNALGERVASGIYFYQLQADNVSSLRNSSLRKMLILK